LWRNFDNVGRPALWRNLGNIRRATPQQSISRHFLKLYLTANLDLSKKRVEICLETFKAIKFSFYLPKM
jgi:hypothetical protein